jgi:type I restriction enzyme, S subunit
MGNDVESQVELPPEWDVVKLERVLALAQYGLSVRGAPQGQYPILRMNCQVDGQVHFDNLQFVDLDEKTFDSFALSRGDLLFNRTNSIELVGRTAIFRSVRKAVFASYLIRLRLDEGQVSPAFVNYYLNMAETQRNLKFLAQRGVSQANINASKLKEFKVPKPPLDEQKRIAALLWKIQQAVNVETGLARNARDLKKAAMRQLFTCGLRGEPQKETPYGEVPVSWRIQPLTECAHVQTGATKGRAIKPEEVIEVPYLRVANVQDGHLDLSEMKTLRIRRGELDGYRLQKDDVVLTEGGDFDKLGRGFIWEGQIEPCVHQNHIFAVRVSREHLWPRYFAYLAQSPYGKSYFLTVAHKTTNLACINTTKLRAFPVLLPPLGDQKEIASILQTIDRKIDMHHAKQRCLQDLFKTMLHKLMTAQVRVSHLNIDTSDVEHTGGEGP